MKMPIDDLATNNGAYSITINQDNLYIEPYTQHTCSLQSAIENILHHFDDRPDLTVTKMMRDPALFDRALIICETARKTNYQSNALLSLKIRMLDYLTGGLRDFDKAKNFIQDIEQLFHKGCIANLQDQALFKVNQGFFESVYNVDLEAATQFMEEGADLWNQLDGYVEEKFRTVINLVQYKILKGLNIEANHLIRQGFECWHDVQSKPYKVIFLYAYSILLDDEGKCEQALSVIEQAADYLQDTKDYPTNELFILNQRAALLIKLKRYEQAQPFWQEAQTKIKDFFKDKPNGCMAVNLKSQGIMEARQKSNYIMSEQLFRKALSMFDHIFRGQDVHRIQASTHLELAVILEGQKKYAEALQEYQISERIYQKLMDCMVIDDVSRLYYHVVRTCKALNDDKAIEIYRQKYRNTFGDDITL